MNPQNLTVHFGDRLEERCGIELFSVAAQKELIRRIQEQELAMVVGRVKGKTHIYKYNVFTGGLLKVLEPRLPDSIVVSYDVEDRQLITVWA